MHKVIPYDSLLVPDKAELVFKGKMFEVYQWSQEQFDGSFVTFEMLKRSDIVTAICVVDGKIIVLDEEQPHEGRVTGLPSGRLDRRDKDPVEGAKREIAEETGYVFKNWKLYRVYQPHNKIEWFVHLFVAWDVLERKEPSLDPGERITVHLKTLEEVNELIKNKEGYFGAHVETFQNINSIEDLIKLPQFEGKEVDR